MENGGFHSTSPQDLEHKENTRPRGRQPGFFSLVRAGSGGRGLLQKLLDFFVDLLPTARGRRRYAARLELALRRLMRAVVVDVALARQRLLIPIRLHG